MVIHMKNLYYNIYEYIEENRLSNQVCDSESFDIALDLNNGFKIIRKEVTNNEKFKSSSRFNVSYRATHKNS